MSFQTIVIPKKIVNDWSDPAFKSAYQKAYREANKEKLKEKKMMKTLTPREEIINEEIINEEIINEEIIQKEISTTSSKEKKTKLTENVNEYNKSYYQKNREKLLKKANENKERRNEYYICACGCEVRLNNSTHKKTDKHFKYLQIMELELMTQEDTRKQENLMNLITMYQRNNIIK